MSEKLYQIALNLIPHVGYITAKNLVRHFGSAKSVFQAQKKALTCVNGIGDKIASSILTANPFQEAESIIKKAEAFQTQILYFTDQKYPDRLKSLKDAPTLLYYQGNADLNTDKVIAIVGTRSATDYGKDFTHQFLGEINKNNLLIISGLAYGIDIKAHLSAIQYDIPNIAVMGTGIDRIYPSEHKSIAKRITQNGGLITENQFGTNPDALRFPERNRIIAGMADVTLVVEAKQKGGALITAHIADSYHRQVCALPGSINASASAGCNDLIKNHKAHLITSAQDLEKLLNWDTETKNQKIKKITPQLESKEKLIYDILCQHENIHIDQLAWQTAIQPSELASILLEMEFRGLVKSLPGKRFSKTNF